MSYETKEPDTVEKAIQILHLEDDAMDAELVRATLESAGIACEISRVQSSDEFCNALHMCNYDLILADYHLPSYDGISALRFVQEQYPDIPFIFVSGMMGEDAAIEGLTQGATDYVLKNRLARLAPALKRALGEKENFRKRKQAEEALRESEMRYREIFENVSDCLYLLEVTEDGRFRNIAINPAMEKSGGLTQAQLIGETQEETAPEEAVQAVNSKYRKCIETGTPIEEEVTLDLPMGRRIYQSTIIPVHDKTGRVHRIVGVSRDITEHKQYELEREAIVAVANAIRTATTRAEILTIILDQINDLFEADGATLATLDASSGEVVIEMGRGPVGERFTGLRIPPGTGVSSWVIANKKPYLNTNAPAGALAYRPDLFGDSQAVASVPLIAQEQVIGAMWIARKDEIAESDLRLLNAIANLAANAIQRVTLYEQTEQQLRRLIALHQIDTTISASLDLNITFMVLLNNVISHLNVDAASILLLTPHTQTLEYAAGTGFRTRNVEQSRVRLGEGQVGTAALQRRIVSLPDLNQALDSFSRVLLFSDEKFTSHHVAPLIAKGQIKGVLEVFTRERLDPAQEWLDFFETLATQAAIAIDSAALFNNLQNSNTELRLAYDATIEGWSRALDMRDKETEGHTQRVTEMALSLATKMGMSDMEKLDLRRGALLHDIGKMGIPDSILLKPGKLTDDEWKIMRQHPTYAYEMLAPISYLKQALDIPYCHHEKWDGTGYPRGLKGNQIPFAARIFAIVDVFDALVSDRPYRSAESKTDAYQYIREQEGKYFDPDVVNAFLKIQY
jgi:PAS domain S-box-containing protein/putative nucleotidyltransferase with HDIG domain